MTRDSGKEKCREIAARLSAAHTAAVHRAYQAFGGYVEMGRLLEELEKVLKPDKYEAYVNENLPISPKYARHLRGLYKHRNQADVYLKKKRKADSRIFSPRAVLSAIGRCEASSEKPSRSKDGSTEVLKHAEGGARRRRRGNV